MAQFAARNNCHGAVRLGRVIGVLTASLLLGACAQGGAGQVPGLFASNQDQQAPLASDAEGAALPHSELQRATAYWGQKYAAQPKQLEPALAYARNLKAMGEKQKALAVLQQAGVFHADSRELAGEYGRLALELDQIGVAEKLLARADDPTNPDWRIISARGTVLAKKGNFAEAIPYYQRAMTLKQNHPSLLNNLAMAHAMNGEADKAETLLRQASAAGSSSPKVRQNLALVLGLQGKYDESRQVASQDMNAASAAENAGQLQKLVRLDPIAAPSQASTMMAQAAQPGFKPSAVPAVTTSTGWDSKVATADLPPVTSGGQ